MSRKLRHILDGVESWNKCMKYERMYQYEVLQGSKIARRNQYSSHEWCTPLFHCRDDPGSVSPLQSLHPDIIVKPLQTCLSIKSIDIINFYKGLSTPQGCCALFKEEGRWGCLLQWRNWISKIEKGMLLELAVRSRESNHYLRYHNIRLCYTWYGSLSAGGTFGFEIFIMDVT